MDDVRQAAADRQVGRLHVAVGDLDQILTERQVKRRKVFGEAKHDVAAQRRGNVGAPLHPALDPDEEARRQPVGTATAHADLQPLPGGCSAVGGPRP